MSLAFELAQERGAEPEPKLEVHVIKARTLTYVDQLRGPLHAQPTNRDPDFCDRAGAEKIKAQIETYWAERGAVVNVQVFLVGFLSTMRSSRYDIRSDMRNGLPAPLPSSQRDAA